ncbi:MAG: alpha/beta hydrolase [Actinobacteria bacterium]|jgi:fermentation-respiration switch protein FrsA (DUF1100 family)|nr:alpha/beta hydrolase [Actinomycetota bacterium]
MTTVHTTIRHPVSFVSHDLTLAGDLHLPAGHVGPGPAAVVTGSWTTVKEQMAGLYAQRLAERGYVTLSFDFRGYGASEGEPRDVELPAAKVEDISNAVDFLAGRDEVDAERIGALAVCASSGYAAVAATRDDRIRALTLVAPWLHDAELVKPIYGGPEGVRSRVEAGRAARKRFEATGEVDYVPAVSAEDESAAMFGAFGYYLDGARGGIPQWGNRFAVMAWPEWLSFDPISVAPRITVPTTIVHSDDAAIPEGARRFAEKLEAPHDALWIGGTQFDFYDQEPNVGTSVDAAASHFAARL